MQFSIQLVQPHAKEWASDVSQTVKAIDRLPESLIGLSLLRPLFIAVFLVGSVWGLRFALFLVVANDTLQRADTECGAFLATDGYGDGAKSHFMSPV